MIVVVFYGGEGEMDWEVPVSRVGVNLFRVEEHPDFFDHVADFGDVFEATSSEDGFRFVRVVERSHFKRFEFTIGIDVVTCAAMQRVFAKVEALGGRWDFMINFLYVYVPMECAYDPTAQIELVRTNLSARQT